MRCLPAELHNRPERIAPAVRDADPRRTATHYDTIFVAYGDCGTGGVLDAVLREEGIERLPGAHCYEFFAGTPGVRRSSRTPSRARSTSPTSCCGTSSGWSCAALGLDRHPELAAGVLPQLPALVYLAQVDRARQRIERARADRRPPRASSSNTAITGYGELGARLRALAAQSADAPAWQA